MIQMTIDSATQSDATEQPIGFPTTRRTMLRAGLALAALGSVGSLAGLAGAVPVPANRGVAVTLEGEIVGHILNRQSFPVRLNLVPVAGPLSEYAVRGQHIILPALPTGLDPMDEDAVALSGVEGDLEVRPGTYSLRAFRVDAAGQYVLNAAGARIRVPVVDGETVDAEEGATGERITAAQTIPFADTAVRARASGCGRLELRNTDLDFVATVGITGPRNSTITLQPDERRFLTVPAGQYTVTGVSTAYAAGMVRSASLPASNPNGLPVINRDRGNTVRIVAC